MMSKYSLRAKLALSREGVEADHPQFEAAKEAMAAYLEAQDAGVATILEAVGIKVDESGKRTADKGRASNGNLAKSADKVIKGKTETHDMRKSTTSTKASGAASKSDVDAKAEKAAKAARSGVATNPNLAKKEAKLKGIMESLALDNLFIEHIDALEATHGVGSLDAVRSEFFEAHNYHGKLEEAVALIESIDAELALMAESALIPNVNDLEAKADEAANSAKDAAAEVTKKADEIANLVGAQKKAEAELASGASQLVAPEEPAKN